MTRREDFSLSLTEQAAAWAVRVAADDASEEDFLALEAWLEQSPKHAAAYTEAESLLHALDDDRAALDAALTRAASSAVHRLPSRSARPGTGRRWAAAAAVAVAAAVVAGIVLTSSIVGRTQVYVTAPGEQRTVTLADGSVIALNGGSRVSVRLGRRERLVEMGAAEAAFDVAHDADRPFRVTVGESQVEVLGTAFDIRRGRDATRVAVTRGVVRVSDLDDPAHNVRLTRGEALEREDGDETFQLAMIVPEPAGWRTGRLIYEDRTLSEVVADLNRAYPTPIRLVGGTGDLRFSGVLTVDDQAATIRRLEAFLPVAAVPRDGSIELRPR
jgi:transmembrane sensor